MLVVTDSTASLGDLDGGVSGLRSISLHINVAGQSYLEGAEIDFDTVVAHLEQGTEVSTSQPNLEEFTALFASAFEQGYTDIVAVHISGALSGTFQTASVAARQWSDRVTVLDSGLAGLALGIAARAGAQAASEGADAQAVIAAIEARTKRAGALFMVDSLEHLRRGGRLSGPLAAVGTALGLKPLLVLSNGEIQIAAKLRSRNAALGQMYQRAMVARVLPGVEFGVHYFGNRTHADQLAQRITTELAKPVFVTAASAVLGAHVGPGLVALTWA